MDETPPTPAVALEQVTRDFDALQVLEPIDLTVAAESFMALIGPSGCGKSTLLRLMAGLDMPSEGRVHAHGAPVTAPSPDRGVVFQQPALFPWLDVASNVGFGLVEAGLARGTVRDRVAEWVRIVGLDGFADALPRTLSGGMAQRAALARALAPQPRLLLLDEPFGALDRITRQEMQDLLAGVRARTTATVILVTHDVEEAVYLADRVIVLSPRPGRIVADVSVDLPSQNRGRTDTAFLDVRTKIETALADAMTVTSA